VSAACRGAFAALALVLGAAAATADAPRGRRILQPDVAGLGEPVQLTLELSADGFDGLAFQPRFRLENLELLGAPSTARQRSWVGGRSSASLRLTFHLRPLAVGPAAVRGIRLEHADGVVELPDAQIEIVAERPPERRQPGRPGPADPFDALFGDPFAARRRAAPPRPPAPKLHLRTSLSPAAAWVGEQLTWRLLLDTQADISAFTPRRLPDFEGFWVRDVPLPERSQPEWIEFAGERFGRVPMLQRAIFPLRAGRFELAPTTADLVARVAEVGWFGPLGRDELLTLTSAPLVLEVRPLPPAPAGFSGAVGALEVTAAVERPRLAVGEATTLTVAVSGFGHLQSLAPPGLDLPAGLRAFEPHAETREEILADRVRTTRVWSWVLLAARPGRHRPGPIGLIAFDPAIEDYRTFSSPSLEIEVTAAPAVARADPAADTAGTPGPGPAGSLTPFRLLLAAAALAALAGGSAALLRRSSPHRRLRRELAAALAAARAAPPRQAAADLEAAWRAFAARQWDIPPGLPAERWGEPLAAAGLGATAVRELREHFEDLHFLRWAPELSDVETLREEAVDRSAQLLRELTRPGIRRRR
jgi:hypothetical protein